MEPQLAPTNFLRWMTDGGGGDCIILFFLSLMGQRERGEREKPLIRFGGQLTSSAAIALPWKKNRLTRCDGNIYSDFQALVSQPGPAVPILRNHQT